jgi:hypothetical protein
MGFGTSFLLLDVTAPTFWTVVVGFGLDAVDRSLDDLYINFFKLNFAGDSLLSLVGK